MLVVFGGSRSLSASFAPLVAQVVSASLARGFSLRVGCARGADRFVVQAALAQAAAPRLSVFCAGNPTSRLYARAAAAGARVQSFAGGQPNIPIVARLALRSRRSAEGCSVAVFFLSSPGSHGSLVCAGFASSIGSAVFAFSCGFSGAPAPLPGCAGAWLPSSLASCPCWRWQPAAVQPALF